MLFLWNHFRLAFLTKKWWLITLGVLVGIYAFSVLVYVKTAPDLGLRSIFSPYVKKPVHPYPPLPSDAMAPLVGDKVDMVGDQKIATWGDLLNAPYHIQEVLDHLDGQEPTWARRVLVDDEPAWVVDVTFRRPGMDRPFTASLLLTKFPLGEMIPSLLWFALKFGLFVVGTLVLWKRPGDNASAQFFLLCVFTLGAFMGGYHWASIANQPFLLLVFMMCAVMLPVVGLHFYLVFPHRKLLLIRHPRIILGFLYGVPLGFLVAMVALYFRLRGLVQARAPLDQYEAAFVDLRLAVYIYLVVAALWYLGCVVALIHSRFTVRDATERNQVKWILYGAVLSLIPIGYSFYLAVWDPNAFGAGAATWPMFAASACLTIAFAISITRYRLMELDKIISSGMGYFLVSFLAGVCYWAVVFIGTLIFNQVIASPKLSEALAVSTTALILMLFLDLARSRIKKVLDRRFSRDKTQLDRTLQRLGQAIGQLVDPAAMAQKFLQATAELLGVARGAIYLRQGESSIFEMVGQVGLPPELTMLAPGCPLLEAVHNGQPLHLRGHMHEYKSAQRQLQFLGGEIAHPLVHEGRLLAVLVLGRKDLPYRTEDLDLLAAFGQITVLALESAEGHRMIEQLNRDLQDKVVKISEQQRRILALQTQLQRQTSPDPLDLGGDESAVPEEQASVPNSPAGGILGNSPAVNNLLHLVRKVAATDAVVLIRGESGTGKELLARAVFENSPRADKPFVKVHCAALSAGLLESELFGHVKGAFTGAHRNKVGRFELAHGGTLFLDEIGDINLEVQTKLLRVLQEKTLERVGSSEPVQVDVRILAATHQDLEKLIQEGRFREDLFYRLNVFPIQVPPLRQRLEDIPELVLHFVRQCARRCKKDIQRVDDEVVTLLKNQPWPGNIRQLENVLERAVVIAEGSSITCAELPEEMLQVAQVLRNQRTPQPRPFSGNGHTSGNGFAESQVRTGGSFRGERDRMEREQLVRALAAADGNKAEAARALGIARSTLVSKLKKLGLG